MDFSSALGMLSALLAAFFWAIATRWFKGLTEQFSFLGLNFAKGGITIIALVAISFLVEINYVEMTSQQLGIILISGIIGIGIGDTLLFAALKKLSEKHTLVIAESIAPIFVVIGGIWLLDEWLSWQQLIAIVMIIISVDWVLQLRRSTKQAKDSLVKGALLAIGAAFCQAVGILMVRDVYVDISVDPFVATFLRILGGLAFIICWSRGNVKSLMPHSALGLNGAIKLVVGSLIGTLGALVLVQIALINTPAAIVQTLIATSAIFASIIALIKGERTNTKVWVGIVVAWIGVMLMVTSAASG
ncbi:DMT family transporter [Thalassotalea ganghwensis]